MTSQALPITEAELREGLVGVLSGCTAAQRQNQPNEFVWRGAATQGWVEQACGGRRASVDFQWVG